VDTDAKLSGVVPVGKLLVAGSGQQMSALRSEPLVSIPSDARDKEVFELFDKYNLRVLSVVDEGGCPIGMITVDDVVTRLVEKV
jgi:Mg/Co/Ni transporter MgtE